MFYTINNIISSFVWGTPMLTAFLGTGFFLSFKSGFYQIFGIKQWINLTIADAFRNRKSKAEKGAISPFAALSSALAASLGTGNIVGIATAICAGGPGTVFWMWISAILGMMTCCCENILVIKYRIKNALGQWIGSPMHYIEKGLGSKWLAKAYAFLLMGASLGMGNMTQANSACISLGELGIKPVAFAAFFAPLVLLSVSGGLKRISAIAEKLIPLLSAVFIGACLIILFKNIDGIIPCLKLIIKEAFSVKAVSGYGMAKAARYGISRGVFSNEAGLGSNSIIHASAECDSPAVQGMWGMFEVMFDTLVMCSITAITVLSSGEWQSGTSLNGIELCSNVFSGTLGSFGSVLLAVCLCLYAYATLIAWSFYGKSGAIYLFGEKSGNFYNIIFAAAAFIGCIMKLEAVWTISDTFNGLMAIPNLIAVLLLSRQAINELKKAKTI